MKLKGFYTTAEAVNRGVIVFRMGKPTYLTKN